MENTETGFVVGEWNELIGEDIKFKVSLVRSGNLYMVMCDLAILRWRRGHRSRNLARDPSPLLGNLCDASMWVAWSRLARSSRS